MSQCNNAIARTPCPSFAAKCQTEKMTSARLVAIRVSQRFSRAAIRYREHQTTRVALEGCVFNRAYGHLQRRVIRETGTDSWL